MRRVLALPFLVLGCTDDPAPSGPAVESHVDFWEIPGRYVTRIDLLLVIDHTTAMAPYQTQLAALPAVTEAALFGDDKTNPDVRVAVTTTDAAGALRATGTSDPYIALGLDVHYRRTTNFTGSFAAALAPMIDVGASASTAVQPLAAAQAALDANPSFLREYSFLGVVIITASDDASSDTPASYANALKARRDDPLNAFVGATYAPPAPRIDGFLAALPNRGFPMDITTDDVSTSLVFLENTVRNHLAAPCVVEPLDLDPERVGGQYDCAIEAVYDDDTTEILRQCPSDITAPCYEFTDDPILCNEIPGYKTLRIKGFPTQSYPNIRGQCVVAGGQ